MEATRGFQSMRSTIARARRAFTLVELMVAVAVLTVVILVTARLFGTASKVSGLGEATEDVAQEVTAIQRQMRDDLRRLSQDGFIVIRSFRVPNNLHDPLPLLDPTKSEDAYVRSDQLLFFTQGLATTKAYVPYNFNEDGSNDPADGIYTGYPQATEARMYYGHGFGLANADPLTDYDGFTDGYGLRPWSVRGLADPVPMLEYDGGNTDDITFPLVQARNWPLVRQQTLLADDGGDRWQFMISPGIGSDPADPDDFINAHHFIFNPTFDTSWPYYDFLGDAWRIQNNRVDIASMTLADVREFVRGPQDQSEFVFNHFDQRFRMLSGVFYPRAEKQSPSIDYRDEFLTNSIIATSCSSFIIEWTYDAKSGNVSQPLGERRWYGPTDADRGVRPLYLWVDDNDSDMDAFGFFPENIDPGEPGVEEFIREPGTNIEIYDAVFGYDRSITPWPSALRITMTLHDPAGRLEQGRTVQFVIELDK